MYQDAFKKLEAEEIKEVLEIYNPLFQGSLFDADQTTILAQDVSFYPGLQYLDIADYSCVPPNRRHVIHGSDTHIVLDWTNEPIYKLNESVPVDINIDTVCDYVRFFFDHIRGQNGRFLIVETVDDIYWRDDPPPTARKTIGEMLVPLSASTQKEESKDFIVNATFMYKDSLMSGDISIQKDGRVSLDNEKLLIEDMPVVDDSFGH